MMTDETTAAPPVVRRKRGRPKRTAPTAPKPPATSLYEGISANSCAHACAVGNCVITHDICGRGMLQPKFMMNPAAVRRKAEAMAFIAHKAVDKKAHR